MVFGNMGDTSGTGVAFTRSPVNGEKAIFGEFLVNAQGEDVVAGIRTPQPIAEMAQAFPEVYTEFTRIAELLEKHYTDMQDMEFTVERNKPSAPQTRNGKRTAPAAVKIAVDMQSEGLIDKETAVMRIEPAQIDQLLHPMFDAEELKEAEKLTKGPLTSRTRNRTDLLNAFRCRSRQKHRRKAILVRLETSPEDLAGMVAAEGILTARGGMTSHAAVVARGMGKGCVSGCAEIKVDEEAKELTIGEYVFKEGDYISLDGTAGDVLKGQIKTVPPELSGDFAEIMSWADEIRTLKIRTNADNP